MNHHQQQQRGEEEEEEEEEKEEELPPAAAGAGVGGGGGGGLAAAAAAAAAATAAAAAAAAARWPGSGQGDEWDLSTGGGGRRQKVCAEIAWMKWGGPWGFKGVAVWSSSRSKAGHRLLHPLAGHLLLAALHPQDRSRSLAFGFCPSCSSRQPPVTSCYTIA
jgi:hypothetical protein